MIRVIQADITKLEVDSIVNAANSQLLVGGGVDRAIHEAAGPGLQNEVKSKHLSLAPGKAIVTSGYHLPAKFVFHTVAPIWNDYDEDEALQILHSCYSETLSLALTVDVNSIAFPSLGTGAFGIPLEKAVPVAAHAISECLAIFEDSGVELEVVICCYSKEDYETYVRILEELGARQLDEHGDPVEPKLPDCPICFYPLKRIAYGMRAPGADNEDIIRGGCIIMPDGPFVGCKNCHWEGNPEDISSTTKEILWFVVDIERMRMLAGALGETKQTQWFSLLLPGSPEFHRSDDVLGVLKQKFEDAKNPSIWFGYRDEIVETALSTILMKYPDLTPEVMRFAGFQRAENLPLFQAVT